MTWLVRGNSNSLICTLEEGGGGWGEEGADVGAEGERVGSLVVVEDEDGLGDEVEEVGGVLREGEEEEGGSVDGEGAAEGLDVTNALNWGR
ncbi:uncharacterized protein A4U43_C08F11600 [Asparagus officinalis]|nr:uncharacterized protein A4U43_C08F11600 [Asparagus officinalis]